MSRTLRLSPVVALAAFAALLPSINDAQAVGTRRFVIESIDQFTSGDLRGVAVDSQGSLRPGLNLGSATLKDATAVFSSLVMSDGSVLLGTSSNGKILKVANGQISEYADTKAIAVTSMVLGPGGAVFAATLPAGKIFKVEGPGKLSELPAIADAESIWQLAYDSKKNTMYAATGPNGKLFSVSATGQATLVFDSDEPNLMSVAVADDGTVYAGSGGKALIYKVAGGGRATILYDCPGEEVKNIQISKGGSLFAICNEFGEPMLPPRRSPSAALNPGGPSSGGSGKAGKGTLFKIETDGRSEKMLGSSDTHYVSLALDDNGKPFVGTGVEGRVYSVDDNHTVTMVADTDERQVGALVVSGKTKFVATSDPAVYHEIRGTGGTDSTWTSKPLDAGIRATWGRLSWRSDGNVELSSRSGNSATPDATWTDWSTAINAPNKTTTPAGRYVQIRARFPKDSTTALQNIELAFVTDNARAVVTHIDAKQKFSGGERGGESVPSSGSDVPGRSSSIKLSWKVDNPDNDQLRYRVQFKYDGPGAAWRDLTKPDDVLSKSEIEWDTTSLPEGHYRIRVEASDENANAPGQALKHSLESRAVLVDNTPPVFKKLTAAGTKISGEVVDGLGPIVRLDYAVDGRTDFRPLAPKDLVLDEAQEEIDVDLSSVLSPGAHLVTIRAYDQAGNMVVRSIEVGSAAAAVAAPKRK